MIFVNFIIFININQRFILINIDKLILKDRIKIEHIINNYKKYKRLAIRYDKDIKNCKNIYKS